MDNADSINVFDDIQSLCNDFRRQLKRGKKRGIEDYLDSLGDASREMLFQNLLHLDVEYRRRQNDRPSSEEYITRFPQFARLIRQTFFQSTVMSLEEMQETPADDQTIVLGLPAARRLGEYELLKELGRGGFGVVYEAKHLQRNERVALKTLPTGLNGQLHPLNDAERLHKFRREFRALSEVNHPNLVGMQSLEVDGDQWFFTMDLVDGVDFLDYVRPGGQLDESRLRSTLTQMVQAIIALHQQEIAHRDLKPSNVLVSSDGHAMILDFGLVAELQTQTGLTISLQSQQFAGTPRYAAPEQVAGKRTTASDWYALPGLGKRLVEKSRALGVSGGNAEVEGTFLLGSAAANASSHNLILGDEQFRQALPLLVKSGYHPLASVTAHLHRHLYSVMQTSSAERELGEEVLRLAEEVGEARGQYWGHYDIAGALARAGNIDEAKHRIEQARVCIGDNRMHLSEAIFLATHGYVLLQASEYEQARIVLEESWHITKKRQLFLEYMVHSMPWLCECLAGPNWLDASHQVDVKRLKQTVKLNWFLYWFYPNLQSPIQRVRGRAFWVLCSG